MSRKILLFVMLLALCLCNILFYGKHTITEAVSSEFKYIGVDSNGSVWYLDTLSYKYSEYRNLINFDIMTDTLIPHKEEIIGWLSEVLRSVSKANNIYAQAYRMSNHYVYNIETRKCSATHISLYNTRNELIYSQSISATWYPIAKNSPADIAISWIMRTSFSEQRGNENTQIKEISVILGISFLIGVIFLLFVSPMYNKQEPRQDTYEPPHQSARQATPDTANILIDTGLAHIGRKTYKANRYLTPEQTEARKRVERPFLRVLADNYRDEQSRKILARHFMVYKEVSLFMVFAFILKRDKELHNTVRERLKELLSQGLLSEVRKKWDENVYRISRTFYDEYKQTRELSHALKAAFCWTVPEDGAVTAERLSELCDKDEMQRIFMYSYDAVLREYRKILEQT